MSEEILSTISFSKKQMNPLLEKYQINPNTNKLFNKIVKMFESKPIYQIWAVKVVFGHLLSMEQLSEIKDFITNHQTIIKNLSKGNITSYTTQEDIEKLMVEKGVVEKMAVLNKLMNNYNTAQKKFLKDEMNKLTTNLLSASTNAEFNLLYDLMTKISRFHRDRLSNFTSLMSATRSYEELKTCMMTAVAESYDWTRESLLQFKEKVGNGADVLYDKDNIIMMKINNFKTSNTLCGGGRTQWCITREEGMWNRYAQRNDRTSQYFIWDFNHQENHELAHIGFTVEKGNGIIYAHSTSNNNLLSSYNIDGKKMNIHDVLKLDRIPKSTFFKFGNCKFKWDVKSFIEFIGSHKETISVCAAKDNIVIVRFISPNTFIASVEHTMMNPSKFNVTSRDDNKIYGVFNFNVPFNDDNAIVVFNYVSDIYGSYAMKTSTDSYGASVDTKYLKEIGINEVDFLGKEDIDPKILLHKYIDENKEKEAIEVLKKNGDNLDVNFRFNNTIPIFKVAENGMTKLFDLIISNKNFDVNSDSGFGESLVHFLIYQYIYELREKGGGKSKMYKLMIDRIIDYDGFNVNTLNITSETILDFACNYSETNWIVEKLVNNKKVNVNVVSDCGSTALGYALEYRNTGAIALLGKRPDLVIRDEDRKLAKENKIDLDKYIKPQPFADGSWEPETVEIEKPYSTYQELFEKVFKANF